MRSDWILDVLADLKKFAQANGLNTLAEQLDDTAIVALSEIAQSEEKARSAHDGTFRKSGQDTRKSGAVGRA